MIKESQENANKGVTVSQEVSELLQRVLGGVKSVSEIVEQVSQATKEQSLGLDQLNQAVQHLDTITQDNASSAEASSTISEELSTQSNELNDLITQLTLLVNGNQPTDTTDRATCPPNHKSS